jgi:hypothetical protein
VIDEDTSVEFKRFLIMGAGFGSVVATLVLAYMTGMHDWLHSYDRFVVMLPTGAFVVGVLAGSGYGIAGWFLTRLRFTIPMLEAIAVSMFVAYAALLLMEYSRNAPDDMGFFEYVDASTRLSRISTTTRLGEEAETTKALGGDGYAYRALELIGLALGGMGGLFIVPAIRKRLQLSAY